MGVHGRSSPGGRARGRAVGSSCAAALAVLGLVVGACADPRSAGSAWPATAPASDRARSLLVIGDSYAQGVGATTALQSFAWQLGRLLDLPTVVDGVGGTGYVNPGQSGSDQRYVERLQAIPHDALDADLVVVEGGLNDRAYASSQVRAAADEFLDALLLRAPDATVVVVGAPAPIPSTPQASAQVNTALRAAAEEHGLLFVDPVVDQWFTVADAAEYVDADQLHPTAAGHEHLAARLATTLGPLVASD